MADRVSDYAKAVANTLTLPDETTRELSELYLRKVGENAAKISIFCNGNRDVEQWLLGYSVDLIWAGAEWVLNKVKKSETKEDDDTYLKLLERNPVQNLNTQTNTEEQRDAHENRNDTLQAGGVADSGEWDHLLSDNPRERYTKCTYCASSYHSSEHCPDRAEDDTTRT